MVQNTKALFHSLVTCSRIGKRGRQSDANGCSACPHSSRCCRQQCQEKTHGSADCCHCGHRGKPIRQKCETTQERSCCCARHGPASPASRQHTRINRLVQRRRQHCAGLQRRRQHCERWRWCDINDFAVVPKATETDAEASIRVLKEQKCRFIYLYTCAPEHET